MVLGWTPKHTYSIKRDKARGWSSARFSRCMSSPASTAPPKALRRPSVRGYGGDGVRVDTRLATTAAISSMHCLAECQAKGRAKRVRHCPLWDQARCELLFFSRLPPFSFDIIAWSEPSGRLPCAGDLLQASSIKMLPRARRPLVEHRSQEFGSHVGSTHT